MSGSNLVGSTYMYQIFSLKSLRVVFQLPIFLDLCRSTHYQGDLSTKYNFGGSSISRIVSKMESIGLVVKRVEDSGYRNRLVEITDKGLTEIGRLGTFKSPCRLKIMDDIWLRQQSIDNIKILSLVAYYGVASRSFIKASGISSCSIKIRSLIDGGYLSENSGWIKLTETSASIINELQPSDYQPEYTVPFSVIKSSDGIEIKDSFGRASKVVSKDIDKLLLFDAVKSMESPFHSSKSFGEDDLLVDSIGPEPGSNLPIIDNHSWSKIPNYICHLSIQEWLIVKLAAEVGVLGILPPNTAKASEAPMFTGL